MRLPLFPRRTAETQACPECPQTCFAGRGPSTAAQPGTGAVGSARAPPAAGASAVTESRVELPVGAKSQQTDLQGGLAPGEGEGAWLLDLS